MKILLIVLDGLSDEQSYFSPLSKAYTPILDNIASCGQCGQLQTIPKSLYPGSEVANLSILGYDVNDLGKGRAFYEALGKGVKPASDECVYRFNLVSLENDVIKDFAPEPLTDVEQDIIIRLLNDSLSSERIRFVKGRDYRHFLFIKLTGPESFIPYCEPPQDILNKSIYHYLPNGCDDASVLTTCILRSREIFESQHINKKRILSGLSTINCIWPWSPSMFHTLPLLSDLYPSVPLSTMIAGIDLMKGIGRHIGMSVPDIKGATGSYDTSYELKAKYALQALDTDDLVYLHIESPDEAGHKGNELLKISCIEDIDRRLLYPIFEVLQHRDDVLVCILPDHSTPCKLRKHTTEPVPFVVWHKNIIADKVKSFTECSVMDGIYGLTTYELFFRMLLSISKGQ